MHDLTPHSRTTAELDSVINTDKTFKNEVSVEFDLDKCAIFSVDLAAAAETESLLLANQQMVKGLRMEVSQLCWHHPSEIYTERSGESGDKC